MFSTKSLKALATFAAIAVLFLAGPTFAADDMKADPALVAVANGPQRSDANKARDQYRHPVETLTFFGLKADMTVVELWPFGGWYTEILAPYLKEHGRLYGANVGADIQGLGRYRTAFENKLASDKVLFDKVATTELGVAETDLAPAGTADMVVTFRNIHNWDQSGLTEKVFDRVYKALKPGGVFYILDWVRAPLPLYLENHDVKPFDQSTSAHALEDLFVHFIEHNRFSREDLEFLLQNTGFDIMESTPLLGGRQARILARKR